MLELSPIEGGRPLHEMYADIVKSNRAFTWVGVSLGDQDGARRQAFEEGLIPRVKYIENTRYADFAGAGVVVETVELPENMWAESDGAHFEYLDRQLPGGKRPAGHTWHHSHVAGRMELVPYGIHKAINHVGGRSPGMWCHPRH